MWIFKKVFAYKTGTMVVWVWYSWRTRVWWYCYGGVALAINYPFIHKTIFLFIWHFDILGCSLYSTHNIHLLAVCVFQRWMGSCCNLCIGLSYSAAQHGATFLYNKLAHHLQHHTGTTIEPNSLHKIKLLRFVFYTHTIAHTGQS